MSDVATSFFARHEFLIRRLHSLSGLVPVGAYMTVHLVVNSSLINGANSFQSNVNQIHSLGSLLPLVEWTTIFLPIIFHAVVGIWIIKSGKSNHQNYKYVANWRYTIQRWTGVIAVLFIFGHVFHLHGWFHNEWWLKTVAEPLGMAQFRAYNAASSLASAMAGFVWPVFYLVGIVSCVFHFANGVWTMGITWGVWISPRAQRYASYVCAAGGSLLLMIGLTALAAAITTDVEEAKSIEDKMYNAKVASGELTPNPHKRSGDEHHESESHEGDEEESDAKSESQPEQPAPTQAKADVAASEKVASKPE